MRRQDDLSRVRHALADRAAFDSLFERYFEPVFRLALRRTRDDGTAQLLAAEMLGHVFGGLEAYDGRISLDAWVLTRCQHVLAAPPGAAPADLTPGRSGRPH